MLKTCRQRVDWCAAAHRPSCGISTNAAGRAKYAVDASFYQNSDSSDSSDKIAPGAIAKCGFDVGQAFRLGFIC
jgi:hypothetical protein